MQMSPADNKATAILHLMSLDIAAVQRALRDDGLDGWLLYDFHGSNPIARRVTGLDDGTKLTTRRWYYLIPVDGPPRALVHAIERDRLDHLPGDKTRYARHGELDAGLRALLTGCRTVAMEFSPGCAIPYVSRVDAGTVDAIRAHGVEVRLRPKYLDDALVPAGRLYNVFHVKWWILAHQDDIKIKK